MPQSKKEGLLLSFIMSFIMIYVMAALNLSVRQGQMTSQAWLVALERLPLGFIIGILCDLLICTPLSRWIVGKVTSSEDKDIFKLLILRFSMVVLMTIAMTVFSVFASGKLGSEGIVDFLTYLPYNFTIALPIQMLIVAPASARLAKKLAGGIVTPK